MSQEIRAHVLVTGKVQGVYFRQNTLDEAKRNRVTGWVKNLPDGRVEAVFEGEEADVKRVVEWCHHGPPRAEVQDVQADYQKYSGEFPDFVISY